MRVEVLNGVERRRRWSRGEKMRIVAESLEAGVTVSEVARRNDVSPSVLFAWRRQVRVPEVPAPLMVPVVVTPPDLVEPVAAESVAAKSVAAKSTATKPRRRRGPAKDRGLIEIDLGSGRRVRVDADVDAKALALVLDVLGRR